MFKAAPGDNANEADNEAGNNVFEPTSVKVLNKQKMSRCSKRTREMSQEIHGEPNFMLPIPFYQVSVYTEI